MNILYVQIENLFEIFGDNAIFLVILLISLITLAITKSIFKLWS